MKKAIAVTVMGLCTACVTLFVSLLTAADDKGTRLDVTDVSFLWPAPKTKLDVAALMAVDETLADGTTSILPQKAFDALLSNARTVSVTDSAGRANQITLADAFAMRSTWKIVAFRVDPSAPGTNPKLIAARGSAPQLRLIVQPVTIKDDTVIVHDFTMHLVFNYIKAFNPPAAMGDPPIAVPDTDKFTEIVKDLAALKGSLREKGITTAGKLNVHPGFNNDKAKDFPDKVKALLKKHLSEDRLGAMAFMGIDPPEPWIFFAMQKQKDGTFAVSSNASLGGKSAQLLIMRGGTPVMPQPTTTNFDGIRGVSTAPLFPDAVGKAKLDAVVFADVADLKHKDVPDLIANPQRSHFFNTDCVSCHSESSRRGVLKIAAGAGPFVYKAPAGISGVDESVLPNSVWNVRNFGWFPSQGTVAPTATMRTANESADSVEFINTKYLAGKD